MLQNILFTTWVGRQAWSEFSKWIKDRDNWTCVTCGTRSRSPQMHAGHFLHKSEAPAIYFDPRNVGAQCEDCNVWNKGNHAVYKQFILCTYGREVFNELMSYKDKYHKFTEKELRAVIAKYS